MLHTTLTVTQDYILPYPRLIYCTRRTINHTSLIRILTYPSRMTHGPPKGILDRTIYGQEVGCETLTDRLPALRPRLHLFGHIHEDHGAVIRDWGTSSSAEAESSSRTDRTAFVNAANYPMGPLAHSLDGGRNSIPGTGAFQPVIVDLLDIV